MPTRDERLIMNRTAANLKLFKGQRIPRDFVLPLVGELIRWRNSLFAVISATSEKICLSVVEGNLPSVDDLVQLHDVSGVVSRVFEGVIALNSIRPSPK
jgi:hypothetical protein